MKTLNVEKFKKLIIQASKNKEQSNNKNFEELNQLIDRINQLQSLIKQNKQRNMLYFVMYDIENNRVRNLIAKYLERKGLIRIQKSIFIADTPHAIYHEIKQTLQEVQEAYENNDSILIVPISTDEIKAMKIIGKNIDIEIITGNKDILFF
ncbi:MAG: CRISPR-associated endonuclease Cas2 [Bacteroidales bacterium]|nr:CRISPR-associated endonuclease Cas2 [Bacteroidales bacterium]